MATIVQYTDQEQPSNAYPQRIVSPLRSRSCCFTDMEMLGDPAGDGSWMFQYKRCKTCGFAVRMIVHYIPDVALAAKLRMLLETAFVRNVPE